MLRLKRKNKYWANPQNRQTEFERLGKELDFTKPEDWYRIKTRDFSEHNARGLLKFHSDHRTKILQEFYPEYEWKEWLFCSASQGFWNKKENRIEYLHWLGQQMGWEQPEDWYRLTGEILNSHYGNRLLKYHKMYIMPIVQELFPHYDWKRWLFHNHVGIYWKSIVHQREYFLWLKEQLGYTQYEDWYKLSRETLEQYYGSGLLQRYKGSIVKMFSTVMPEYEWKEWCFASTPNNYWIEPQHQYDYMKWLGNRLGYTKPEDWYSISKDVFNNNYGGGFLAVAFDNSPIAAVKKNFPEYDWKEWLFGHASTDFWKQTTNLRQYFEWLGEQIGIQHWGDWYNITSEVLVDHNGGSLLNLNQNGSYYSLIINSFPEYDWKRWRFKKIPQEYWEDIENCREYLAWLGNQLGIQRIEDWYKVTQQDFNQNNGGGIMDFYKGSPSAVIITCFDKYNWEIEKFGKTKKRQQHLYHLVERIFHKWHVGWDVKHQEIKFKQTGRSMEIDIFVQELKLGFEYQGEQHFIAIEAWGGEKALNETQRRDQEKRKACEQQGIILIEIAYTWDGTEQQAIELITQQISRQAQIRSNTQQVRDVLEAVSDYQYQKKKTDKKHIESNQ